MPIGSHWSQVETVDSEDRLSPDDIESQQFETVVRGYDPAAVVGFLRDVARNYRLALEEMIELRRELEQHVCAIEPAPDRDQYESMSDEVSTVLRAAYASAAEVRTAAEQAAEELLADARAEAVRLERSNEERLAEVRQHEATLARRLSEADSMLESLLGEVKEAIAEGGSRL